MTHRQQRFIARRSRRIARIAACAGLVAVAIALGGCGMFNRRPVPPCPPVLVVGDANTLTVYREGPGRDVTDVMFNARIADFQGGCEWNRARTEVDIELRVLFDVERGPANRDRKAQYRYFVAIPAFHPAPEGKQIFGSEVTFPENVSRMRLGDTVRLSIPIPTSKRPDEYPVYIGFQLTPEKVEQNRRRSGL